MVFRHTMYGGHEALWLHQLDQVIRNPFSKILAVDLALGWPVIARMGTEGNWARKYAIASDPLSVGICMSQITASITSGLSSHVIWLIPPLPHLALR